ncbi:hypothetical protein CTAYLR_005936 [Chrysophaeum taylorii]|uniref:SGNH hydrolase-type esterase domain-containing protein n=1 Tax=Chrysophaeum taylorii TaxID=2483200 RepID=A0AAD7UAS6_9STRA|nr:hypothetical protein CTAYLR_005936 [Chrysophaeum taylorii]
MVHVSTTTTTAAFEGDGRTRRRRRRDADGSLETMISLLRRRRFWKLRSLAVAQLLSVGWADQSSPPSDFIIKVACVGDSITKGTTASSEATQYPSVLQIFLGDAYAVENYGKRGKTLTRSKEHWYQDTDEFEDALQSEPGIVVIGLGTNDAKEAYWRNKTNPGEDFAGQYADFVGIFRTLPSEPQILVLVPVLQAEEDRGEWPDPTIINEELPPYVFKVGNESGATVVDLREIFEPSDADLAAGYYANRTLYHDEIHPNDLGYEKMASLITDAIRALPFAPTLAPTTTPRPSVTPTTSAPTTPAPSSVPTTPVPTALPSPVPTPLTWLPTNLPSLRPTFSPATTEPSLCPKTSAPTTCRPTSLPTFIPTSPSPSSRPTSLPTTPMPTPFTPYPTSLPTSHPTEPTAVPSPIPTSLPTPVPSAVPSPPPTSCPTASTTVTPATSPQNASASGRDVPHIFIAAATTACVVVLIIAGFGVSHYCCTRRVAKVDMCDDDDDDDDDDHFQEASPPYQSEGHYRSDSSDVPATSGDPPPGGRRYFMDSVRLLSLASTSEESELLRIASRAEDSKDEQDSTLS